MAQTTVDVAHLGDTVGQDSQLSRLYRDLLHAYVQVVWCFLFLFEMIMFICLRLNIFYCFARMSVPFRITTSQSTSCSGLHSRKSSMWLISFQWLTINKHYIFFMFFIIINVTIYLIRTCETRF